MQQLAPSPSQRGLSKHGLVSLWDIMKVLAQKYLDLGEAISDVRGVFYFVDAALQHGDTGRGHLSAEERDRLYETLRQLKRVCAEIPLPVTYELLKGQTPQTARELDLIVCAAKAELEYELFLRVPRERATYYEHDGLLAPQTRTAFPKLTTEMRAAGNCYALGQPTACVFHCMRALEHALNAMAIDVGLTWTKEQWHNIIEMIESKIDGERKALPRGTARDERLNFLSQGAKEFFYFKDGWRNYVSHNRISYGEPQALQILQHVQAFSDHLAANIKEQT